MKCPFKKVVKYIYPKDDKINMIGTIEKFAKCDEKECPFYYESGVHNLEKCMKAKSEV